MRNERSKARRNIGATSSQRTRDDPVLPADDALLRFEEPPEEALLLRSLVPSSDLELFLVLFLLLLARVAWR